MIKWLALLAWMQTCGAAYGVEPEFILAVARVESGNAEHYVRFGPLGRSGKFIGPMGINRCYRSRWDIDDPEVNVAVGAHALRGRDKRQVLQRYNRSFTESYYRAVMATYRQIKRERVFAALGGDRNAER